MRLALSISVISTGRSSAAKAANLLDRSEKNGSTRFMPNASCRARPFSLSNGVFGARTTKSARKKPMVASIEAGPGMRCRPYRSRRPHRCRAIRAGDEVVEKRYEWADGAKLEEHSKRKHKILREYVFDYLTVRCKLPQQERFRLAIVDGFAGGGRYQCGTAGSPLIFIEELRRAVEFGEHAPCCSRTGDDRGRMPSDLQRCQPRRYRAVEDACCTHASRNHPKLPKIACAC